MVAGTASHETATGPNINFTATRVASQHTKAMARQTDNSSTAEQTDASKEHTQLAQFESSLGELEALVEALETGNISLEEALAKFERGVTLTRQCRDLLKKAELRVDQLMADGEQVEKLVRPEE